MSFVEWPVDLSTFELQPSNTQLVFAGDSLPIDCKASNNNLAKIYWSRQGKRVVTNTTAKIQIEEDREDSAMIIVTLK